ncbi:MAG: dTDP-4-dehydrorhamnose reductase [Candidatus Ancaeobacter aquaticus]|nr:dTDP-4-dehydrorhamnose reductase [Candidatus Ancaeobacter aquaticus]
MKILITGSAGMLGSAMMPTLAGEGHEIIATDINIVEDGMECLDVQNLSEVQAVADTHKPDMIMHLAAETDVDKCQIDVDHAYRANTLGTHNIALICQKLDIEMVYISTAGVFYGDKTEPYIEFDIPRPANVYGDSKLQGEIIVQRLLNKYYICRAGWMIGGGGNKDKKFLNKVMQQIKKGAKEIKAVEDKFGSPTYTVDFSKCMAHLIKTGFYGLYHMGNIGSCSRYDIAKKAFEILDINDVKLSPCTSEVFPLPAPRARSESMTDYMLNLRGISIMRPWEEAVTDYIKSNFSK